jgi:hypothetical protein
MGDTDVYVNFSGVPLLNSIALHAILKPSRPMIQDLPCSETSLEMAGITDSQVLTIFQQP